jgi:hypothetical protein
LEDNGELISALFFAMEALAEMAAVLPQVAIPMADGRYILTLEKHLVLFSILSPEKVIAISAIVPPPE